MSDTQTIAALDYATEDRICPSCGESKPPAAFKTPNTTRCKRCMGRSRDRTVQIRSLKSALVKLANRQIVASARGDSLDAPRISQICAKMVELFGGMDKFCKLWSDQIMEVVISRPGSQLALSQLQSIAKLVKDSTSSVDSASEVTSLTDDELDTAVSNAVDGAVSRLISEHNLLESVPDSLDAEAESDGPDAPNDEECYDLDD